MTKMEGGLSLRTPRLRQCSGSKVVVLLLLIVCVRETHPNDRVRRETNTNQPRIVTQSGNLLIEAAPGRNISLVSKGEGHINVAGHDVQAIVNTVQNNKDVIARLQSDQSSTDVNNRLDRIEARLDAQTASNDLTNLQTQINTLSQQIDQINNRIDALENVTPAPTQSSSADSQIRRLRRQVDRLNRQLRTISTNLSTDECSSNPCRNGGTCIDQYNSFYCRCTQQWKGSTCELNVNECQTLHNTDLGCQNGATCIDLSPGFRCDCPPDWFGLRCTERIDDCTGAANNELCAHGTCVNRERQLAGQPRYQCLCDIGWEGEECNIDRDECSQRAHPCSSDPLVSCINVPGTFYCGQCPQGYSGNGFTCTDINECLMYNGGCSTSPYVECINTRGSYTCGACPAAYTGDGRSCTYVGMCGTNNGGCHQLATCTERSVLLGRVCTCPSGYIGNGEGPMGCQPSSQASACHPNPCAHGGQCTPQALGLTYSCTCPAGYTGSTCEQRIDMCQPNPCQNGGTCAMDAATLAVTCSCTDDYSGDRCQTQAQRCGGFIERSSGIIQSPPADDGQTYAHDINCAWVITTDTDQVLTARFHTFHLESGSSCQYDFVQVHDGRSTAARMFGRFCGDEVPEPIVSTTNRLYVWFHSDSSIAHDGFSMSWTSNEPVCGGVISDVDHGEVSSPGYPGDYPPGRDCTWTIRVNEGLKIVMVFASFAMEQHSNCSYDYLAIYDGETEQDPLFGPYCGTSRPAPITTSGPYVLIQFHSDGSNHDHGFHLTYHTTLQHPGCGGLLTAASGTLTSPDYPSPYPYNAVCVWRIQVAEGETVRFTIDTIDLEQQANCRFDYVEVRDGGDELSRLVGRYCGNEAPPSHYSSTNEMWVKFRSDESNTYPGFTASYATACGGVYVGPTGSIQSPYYPAPYPANRECLYTIQQPEGHVITITFDTVDIETHDALPGCHLDYLEIYDGSSETSEVLGRVCGSSSSPPYTSTSNHMLLKFVTDGSVQNQGFRLQYRSTLASQHRPGECGGTMTEAADTFTSPEFPDIYPNGANCSYNIQVDPGLIIKLSFTSFVLSTYPTTCTPRADNVAVYDGPVQNNDTLIGRFCSREIPPEITSTSNEMLVVFTSNSYSGYQGFTAAYHTLNATSTCGRNYYTSSGVITSPGYPSSYPSDVDCVWVIHAKNNYRITLNITDFNIGYGYSGCRHTAYLRIRDGGLDTSPQIGRYCGSRVDDDIVSSSNKLYIEFHSDYSISERGFRIQYNTSMSGCGGTITDATGWLDSPGYPQSYQHHGDCTWYIQAPHGHTIALLLTDVDMEGSYSCYDYIELREVNSAGRQIGRYCRTPAHPSIETSVNRIYAHFHSDYAVSGRGFHIFYHTSCNLTLTDLQGVIEAPTYQQEHTTCVWRIEPTTGNGVNVSFSHLILPHGYGSSCTTQKLEFFDANEASLGTFCGSNSLPDMIHTDGAMTVRYTKLNTYSTNSNSYFRLEYIMNGCGSRLTEETGTFTSPGYPQPYPHRRTCEWIIHRPLGAGIELTINNLDLESSTNCQYDSLKVYGTGRADDNILLYDCGTSLHPRIVSSTGNEMLVRFTSDNSGNGAGFTATYRTLPNGCGGRYSASSGIVTSQNYPQSYPVNTDCTWIITVEPHHTILLNITDFEVEGHSTCGYDQVAIYDGPHTNNSLLMAACRRLNDTSRIVRSTSNVMLIHMTSDGSVQMRGFSANYTTVCGGRYTVSDEPSVLSSPGWPMSYPRNQNCTWILTAQQPEAEVRIHPTHVNLGGECNNTLLLFEGEALESAGSDVISVSEAAVVAEYSAHTVGVSFTTGNCTPGMGFTMEYTSQYTSCGRTFRSQRGAIDYTNENTVDESAECVWTIEKPPGSRIHVAYFYNRFTALDHCNGDYLEIRENSVSGALLTRQCEPLTEIQADTYRSSLWIKLRTMRNEVGAVAGDEQLYLTFAIQYGGSYTGTNGTITSPYYPHFYPHDRSHTWVVTAPQGTVIRVTFDLMDLEYSPRCIHDYVQILDGGLSDSPQLARYCSMMDVSQLDLRSTGNQIRVKFVSDRTINDAGFVLHWTAVTPIVAGSTEGNNTVSSGCGGDLTAQWYPQTLESPGYPYGYADDLECRWTIRSPQDTRIIVNITYLDLERHSYCGYDALRLMTVTYVHGSSFRHTNLARYCNPQPNIPLYYSTFNELQVDFTTDGSANRTGFSLQYQIGCGGVVIGSSGVISTIGHENNENYRPNSNCTWTIEAPVDHTVAVTFTAMDIQSSTGCRQDYVLLYNGLDTSAPQLNNTSRYCGSSVPYQTYESTDRYITVSFISDASDEGTGFSLTYQSRGASCGGHLSLSDDVTSGTITSPNYPQSYPHNVDCAWIIMAPAGQRIHVQFLDQYDIESHASCRYDYVEFRDGGTINSHLLSRVCGERTPSSVTSTSNVIYVRFRTDPSGSNTGFKARYEIATCGGTIVAESGSIQSPGYPSSYANNLECDWTIRGLDGHYLTFTSSVFSTEWSTNCTDDYLLITDRNETGRELRRACGYSMISVDTPTNQAHLKFVTDDSSTSSGFNINFNSSIDECGGTLSGISGNITSPNYPHGYAHNRLCVWDIVSPPGTRITVNVLDFQLEYGSMCGYDFLSFSSGSSSGYRSPLGRYCGSRVPSLIESSGNQMSITFYTDSSRAHRGFALSWSADRPALCGGVLTAPQGTILSPNYTQPTDGPRTSTSGYAHNLLCIWHIEENLTSNQSMTFIINDMDVEHHLNCGYDYVRIIEGELSPFSEPLISTCGTDSNSTDPVTVASGSFWLVFSSDASVNGRGFNISYRTEPCGGVLTSQTGTITSPNYPEHYPTNTRCAWRISANEGQQIQLTLEHSALPVTADCSLDHVQVYNGPYTSSPYTRHCGTSTTGLDFVSYGSEIRVEFVSDGQGNNPAGFRMTYQMLSEGCGGVVHAQSGTIHSPNWPQNYQSNTECLWEINVQPGYQIRARWVPPFDMEYQDPCTNDYVGLLYFIEGGGPRLFCGRDPPPPQLIPTNHLMVMFRSNENNNGNGFALNFTAECGGTYGGSSGTIISPGYPTAYSNNLNCTYTIVAPNPQDHILLAFDPEVFSIEGGRYGMDNKKNDYNFTYLHHETRYGSCRYDYLSIERSDGRYIARSLCGSTVPQVFSAVSNVTITFITDYSVTGRGWKLLYNTTSCGSHMTAPHGTFSSITHNGRYLSNSNCSWYITAPQGRIVSLKFNSFNLEQNGNCVYDSVNVYDGDTVSNSSLIGQFCGDDIPPTVNSRTNSMLVRFLSDGSVTRDGFTASYRITYGEDAGCGGLLTTASGQFSSVDGDNDGLYEADLECIWQVVVDATSVVRLTFTSFNIEQSNDCYKDYIEVRDGLLSTDEVIGRYCGSSISTVITSATNRLYVKFVTDSNTQTSGFVASYTSVPLPCGGVLNVTSTPTLITSPSYPSPYASGLRCVWYLQAPSDEQVLINTQAFSVQPSGNCVNDYLIIRDNPMLETGQVLRYCGTLLPPPFRSHNHGVVLEFVSDSFMSASGFSINASIAGCNYTYSLTSGRLLSPAWPRYYPHNINCWTTITLPNTTSSPGAATPPIQYATIALYFHAFSLESHRSCNYDFLKIYNSTSLSSDSLMYKLCGSNRIPSPVFTNASTLILHFKTDSSANRQGYDITYLMSQSEIAGCGGTLDSPNGTLTSPGYPFHLSNMSCQWILKSSAQKRVSVTFDVFDLSALQTTPSALAGLSSSSFAGILSAIRCMGGSLEIRDGGTSTSPLLGTYCDTELPAVATSTGRLLYISMRTTVSVAGQGFKLRFTHLPSVGLPANLPANLPAPAG